MIVRRANTLARRAGRSALTAVLASGLLPLPPCASKKVEKVESLNRLSPLPKKSLAVFSKVLVFLLGDSSHPSLVTGLAPSQNFWWLPLAPLEYL